MQDNEPYAEVTTLIWAHRTERPEPCRFQSVEGDDAHSAIRWPSLCSAIGYAVGMQTDKARDGLHPWIRTPAGHIYSPASIAVMSDALRSADVADGRGQQDDEIRRSIRHG